MIKIKRQVDINDIKIQEIERDKYYAINFESMSVRDIYYEQVNEIINLGKNNDYVVFAEVEEDEEESKE